MKSGHVLGLQHTLIPLAVMGRAGSRETRDEIVLQAILIYLGMISKQGVHP